MIHGHGGNIHEMARKNGCSTNDIIDMSSNINPIGAVPDVKPFLEQNLHLIESLPEVDAKTAAAAFAEHHRLDPESVLAGNGTTEFIYAVPRALQSKKALILEPAYSDYEDACIMNNVICSYLIADKNDDFYPDIRRFKDMAAEHDTVFICNPNNPTSVLIPADVLESLCWSNPSTFFVIDESYLPFAVDGEENSMLNRGLSNVVILRSMSKIYGVPGLRTGFLTSQIKTANRFLRFSQPWSMNALAQAAAVHLSKNPDKTNAFIRKTHEFLETERRRITSALKATGAVRPFNSVTSFILMELMGGIDAEELCAQLGAHNILIRNCANFKGLNNRFVRISLKSAETNQTLIRLMQAILNVEC